MTKKLICVPQGAQHGDNMAIRLTQLWHRQQCSLWLCQLAVMLPLLVALLMHWSMGLPVLYTLSD